MDGSALEARPDRILVVEVKAVRIDETVLIEPNHF